MEQKFNTALSSTKAYSLSILTGSLLLPLHNHTQSFVSPFIEVLTFPKPESHTSLCSGASRGIFSFSATLLFCLGNKQANREFSQFPEMSTFRSIEKSWTGSRPQSLFLPQPLWSTTQIIISLSTARIAILFVIISAHLGPDLLWQKFDSPHLNYVFICTVWFVPLFPSPNSQQVKRIADK